MEGNLPFHCYGEMEINEADIEAREVHYTLYLDTQYTKLQVTAGDLGRNLLAWGPGREASASSISPHRPEEQSRQAGRQRAEEYSTPYN